MKRRAQFWYIELVRTPHVKEKSIGIAYRKMDLEATTNVGEEFVEQAGRQAGEVLTNVHSVACN